MRTGLEDIGWDERWAIEWTTLGEEDAVAARVAAIHRDAAIVWTAEGERQAELAGRFRHRSAGAADHPAVGDWVAARAPAGDGPALITAVLPRRGRFARKVAGQVTEEQVVAANVDLVVLVAGLDGDYNPRRLERALVLAWDGGAQPLIVLNKADLVAPGRLDELVRGTEALAPGVAVVALSAATGAGMEPLASHLGKGKTAALLGSSGVGKSTLVNRLLGNDRQRTAAVREDDSRGRHTTTYRELLRLPGGALVVDTPGLRELQLWGSAEAVDGAFPDVDELAARCRYADCRHAVEPGCAVVAAAAADTLDAARLESYRKLQRELRHLALRQDELGRREEKVRWRAIHKAARKHRPRE